MGCCLQRCGSSGSCPDGEPTPCHSPPAASLPQLSGNAGQRISMSGLQSHPACRYNRVLRKLNRRQRLRLTAEAYPAPATFFTQSGLEAPLAAADPKLDQSAAADGQSLPATPERPVQPGATTTSGQPGPGADGAMHLEMQVSASSFTGKVCHAALPYNSAFRQKSHPAAEIPCLSALGCLLARLIAVARRVCCTAAQVEGVMVIQTGVPPAGSPGVLSEDMNESGSEVNALLEGRTPSSRLGRIASQ